MGRTLHSAAKKNNWRQLQRYIQQTANLNERDSCNYTALMYAAEQGHAEAVFLLLSAGADLTLTVETHGGDVLSATALTLLMYSCNNEEKKALCILFFSHHNATTNLLEDGSLFHSQNGAHNMTEYINKTINDYQKNPAEVAKIIRKMPTNS